MLGNAAGETKMPSSTRFRNSRHTSMTTFDAQRSGTGTHEWAEVTENIARGCPNDCLYCYAATNANRFKLRQRSHWKTEELTKRAAIASYPAKGGVIMFPSAHDITPFNVEAFIRVARLMLAAGNKLLIVSKPRLDCIRQVAAALQDHKPAILFRFTIGTTDTAVAAHWEPGAPAPTERLDALKLAHAAGYRTSVSAEPLLGGLEVARRLLDAVRPYVTDTVWIGKMNKIRARVDMSVPANKEQALAIEQAQTDDEVQRLFGELDGDPLVRWKDSIHEVMARRPTPSEPLSLARSAPSVNMLAVLAK